MTRPMPGPPEHDLDTREHDGNPAEWCTRCHLINMPDIWAPAPKRLTDAECAAEYWRALREDEWDDYLLDDGYGPPNIDPWGKEWWSCAGTANEERLNTWHRFATHPHALEEA